MYAYMHACMYVTRHVCIFFMMAVMQDTLSMNVCIYVHAYRYKYIIMDVQQDIYHTFICKCIPT